MSFSTADTIVAIATPPGRGGIGVVRISGPDALQIAARLVSHETPLEPRRATFTTFRSSTPTGHQSAAIGCPVAEPSLEISDHVVATYFPAPHSYTGEHVLELSAHGSPVVLQAIVSAAMACGARLAEPGEFTLRAFLNERIDLAQAEAVADLIDAVTPVQARVAFDQLQGTLTTAIAGLHEILFDLIARLEASVDFPDEGYHFVERHELAGALDDLRTRLAALLIDGRRGRLVREGLQVAIVGRTNVGKSSLFNRLVGSNRAIVTAEHGTTRDLVTETVDLEGLRVTLVDTAGLRESTDPVEIEGVARSRQAQQVADLILVVIDGSRPVEDEDIELVNQTIEYKRLLVFNKADVTAPDSRPSLDGLTVSARTGEGLNGLVRAMLTSLDIEHLEDRPAITNVRHIALVERADKALARAQVAVGSAERTSMPEEFVLADLQEARATLEEITGHQTTDDLLRHIFARFCVGK